MKKSRQHLNRIMEGYTHSLTIAPKFHGNFAPNDERSRYSPLGQFDTIYRFDCSRIVICHFRNEWQDDRLVGRNLRTKRKVLLAPSDVFIPFKFFFEPEIIYVADERFGKLVFTTNRSLRNPYKITVPLFNPANFTLSISTGVINYRLAYNWEHRLCVY